MEMTTAKTIAVFAVIFGCFAVLYPKIFHPMLLYTVGAGPATNPHEDLVNRVPPHLRRPGQAKTVPQSDDFSQHMRAGPHPGLRAAAEMKKQAAATQGGSGKGMMSVVLPMYAVGIVIYLIYTMTKVFGKNNKNENKDYIDSHFNDVNSEKPGPGRQQRTRPADDDILDSTAKQNKRNQRDLERLLIKADKDKISSIEMHQLKQRLLETEAQMTRILQAMETVTDKVNPADVQLPQEPTTKETPTRMPDLSPDMDSYEFVNSKRDSEEASSPEEISPVEVEELSPAEVVTNKTENDENNTEEEVIGDEDGEEYDDDDEVSDEIVEGDEEDVILGQEEEHSDEDEERPDLRKRRVPTDAKKPE